MVGWGAFSYPSQYPEGETETGKHFYWGYLI